MRRNSPSDDRGQTLAIVALMLTALFGFMGLVADIVIASLMRPASSTRPNTMIKRIGARSSASSVVLCPSSVRANGLTAAAPG